MLGRGCGRGARTHALAAAFVSILCLLGLPASAIAAEYTVDSTADEPDAAVGVGGCLTAAAKCTLRAAIQESNASVAVKDTVAFDGSFDAQAMADTIALGAGFPAMTDAVTVDGKTGDDLCATTGRPCVGVDGPEDGLGLRVEADDVTIEGLAITGAATGISVVDASTGFLARGNWVGLELDLGAGENQTGIYLGPGSDGATLGGYTLDLANYFGHNALAAVDVEGASGATIVGNRFGALPSGAVVPNGANVEISDAFAGALFEAVGNEVGDRILDVEPGTCNEGCNVLAAADAGVDLIGDGGGEAPPTGPTTVRGNYVGIDDTGAVARNKGGVLIGAAGDVTVGGPTSGDANHINGGFVGVYAWPGAARLVVEGNEIGLDPSGGGILGPPFSSGIVVDSTGIAGPADEAAIVRNAIGMDGVGGISHHGPGATIANNLIIGSEVGIRTAGDAGWGNLVAGNTILDTGGTAISIGNSRNDIVGNTIIGAWNAGIRIHGDETQAATENQVGGDEKADENEISGVRRAPIWIRGTAAEGNEVGRNFGSGSGGLFVDVGAEGPGNSPVGPNDGIQAPTIGIATTSTLGGTARPGAVVRVFRKASPSPGEIEAFLGQSTAGAEGNWTLALDPAVEAGTILAASQTDEAGNTSELALTAVTPPAGIVPPGGVVDEVDCAFLGICASGGGGGGGSSGSNADPDGFPPETTIVKGAKRKIEATSATFRFGSSEAGSRFECKLDRSPFRGCGSPERYRSLRPGRHVFRVRAIDAAGNVDATPARRRWRVVP
jgi:CSLREA domain-containing protein